MKGYRLVLYDGDGYRIGTSTTRLLCVQEEGRSGWVSSSAVVVDDPDEWRWYVFRPIPPDDPDDDDPINRPGEISSSWI
jgi:hypothetical protein